MCKANVPEILCEFIASLTAWVPVFRCMALCGADTASAGRIFMDRQLPRGSNSAEIPHRSNRWILPGFAGSAVIA